MFEEKTGSRNQAGTGTISEQNGCIHSRPSGGGSRIMGSRILVGFRIWDLGFQDLGFKA